MKEKRYFCDWVMSIIDKKSRHVMKKIGVIFFVAVIAISSLIYYNVVMHKYEEYLEETYSESAYEYLDEIANNVIEKDGINLAAMPEDVVEYEITYKDDGIIFTYSLDNNKGKERVTSASMTIALSENFEVLSKEPNYSSKDEYVKSHKAPIYLTVFMFAMIASFVLCTIYCGVVEAMVQSREHKRRDMEKYLS